MVLNIQYQICLIHRLHFSGSVSFQILFFQIKDKNLLISKFF